MSLYPNLYGYHMDEDGDAQMDHPMSASSAHNILAAAGANTGAGAGDYTMHDLASDMLPFDLDLNALPAPSDVSTLNRLSAAQGPGPRSSNLETSADIDSGRFHLKNNDNYNNNNYNDAFAFSNASNAGNASNANDTPNTTAANTNTSSNQIVIGAGPLPDDYGVPLPPGQGSTLTDFTKRRNWAQRVVEELKDFLHVLSPDGRLVYVSPSTKSLIGYEPEDLVGKLVAEFIHPDDSHMFIREFNESIATGNPLRFFYRFRKPDDTYAILECHGHPHFALEAVIQGSNNNDALCRGFFMMSRPYPTRSAAELDSFLEHKVENERLRKRIAELKREEQEDMEGQQHFWLNRTASGASTQGGQNQAQEMANSGDQAGDATSHDAGSREVSEDYKAMPPPAKPCVSNVALTRQNLDEALSSSRPDSINDKMARYEGATHIETIEMLTGLRYRDGERSQGISTGDQSPVLIRGDAGIPIQVDKDGRPTQGARSYGTSPYGEHGDRKKKIKVADEYVCTDCGTLDSPEWRKGPSGPKTLCNACGLRWAKKEKKRGGPFNESDNGNGNCNGSSTAQSSIAGLHTPLSNTQTASQQLPALSMQPQMGLQGIPMLAHSMDSGAGPSAPAPQ